MLVFVLFLLASKGAVADEQSRVVHTAQGPVKGYKDPSGDFYAFYSIPYATAPTGPRKFKGPLPPPAWDDVFEAIDKKIVCPQSNMLLQAMDFVNYTIAEDCLIANVFVPDIKPTDLSVVVYVHGGAFQVGYGNMVTHRSLLNTGKIIVVNFNYRMGAHGFLCLGTEDAPGNAGMKDQVAALRWVKRNIASFGGNPNDITVAGYSAGAVAVELLLVSESTRGLFNKVIPESGAGVGVWAIQSNPLDIAKSFAHSQGSGNVEDIYVLEDFFRNLPLDILMTDAYTTIRDGTLLFVPCIEREGSDNVFLTEAPVNIIKNGNFENLPVLTGIADMEGLSRLNMFDEWKTGMNAKFSDFLPADLQFINDDERNRVAHTIKEFYFGEEAISTETVLGYVNYFSDILFAYPTHRSVTLQSAAGSDSLYLYMYGFVEDDAHVQYPGLRGADHCAQTGVVGDPLWLPKNDAETSESYKKVKELMVDVWKNFIVTGHPTPKDSLAEKVLGGEWLPTSVTRPHHALFNATSELRSGVLLDERMKFWDDIYSEYYRTPIPPPKPPTKSKSEL